MEISKIQKFLKNMHKFDRQLRDDEIIDSLKDKFDAVINAIKKDSKDAVEMSVAALFIELLNIENKFGVDLSDSLKEKLKFEI